MAATTPLVESTETLRATARALVEAPCGAVIVTGPGGPIGVITDQDMVLAVSLGLDLDRIRAADAMRPTPHVVMTDDDPSEVGKVMVRLGLRHVAVLDQSGSLHLASSFEVLHLVLGPEHDAGLSSERAVPPGQGP